MGAQRTSFEKLQRDRAKKAKAAAKREKRQSGEPMPGEATERAARHPAGRRRSRRRAVGRRAARAHRGHPPSLRCQADHLRGVRRGEGRAPASPPDRLTPAPTSDRRALRTLLATRSRCASGSPSLVVGLAVVRDRIGCSSSGGVGDAPTVTVAAGRATQGRPLTVVGDSLVGARSQADPGRARRGRVGRADRRLSRAHHRGPDPGAALRGRRPDGAPSSSSSARTTPSRSPTDGSTRTRSSPPIGQALDLFGDRCVVWVVPGRDPRGHGADGRGGHRRRARGPGRRSDPNLHLADFGAVLEEHPEYLLDDQVHLTDEGSQALAELMADAARTCR